MPYQEDDRTSDGLTLVGPRGQFPKVTLVEPTQSGYLLLAAEIDRRPPFLYGLESSKKRHAKTILKVAAENFKNSEGLTDATVFKALLLPPGRSSNGTKGQTVASARYDLVLLLEFASPERAKDLKSSHDWKNLESKIARLARRTLCVQATNARRIGPVDHSKDGIFLFNYFVADALEQNLGIWEYTAGWFEDQTGLDNSTLLVPSSEDTDFTVINHCRWDGLSDIMPSLLFKRSFRKFVLANFAANRTVAMPILYSLA